MRLAIAAGFFRRRLLAHLFPVGHRQAEFREDILMLDRLIVLEPLVGLGYGLALGITQGVSIFFRRDHGLEQMNHRGKLARAGFVVDRSMGITRSVPEIRV